MGEPANDRVQLHNGAGHACVQAHLNDSTGSFDLDVVADARRNEFRSAMD